MRCPIALSSSIFSASLLYNSLCIPGSKYPQPALWSTSDLCSHFAVPLPNFTVDDVLNVSVFSAAKTRVHLYSEAWGSCQNGHVFTVGSIQEVAA